MDALILWTKARFAYGANTATVLHALPYCPLLTFQNSAKNEHQSKLGSADMLLRFALGTRVNWVVQLLRLDPSATPWKEQALHMLVMFHA